MAEIQAESEKRKNLAIVEADMARKYKEVELQREVDIKTKEQMLEHNRANTLAKATVDAEALERLADAHLYQKRKEADGVLALYQAQAEGLDRIVSACNDSDLAQFYLALNANLYPELAEKSAKAVQNLKPKVHIWNTGNGNQNNDIAGPFTRMIQSFAPMLDGLSGNIRSPFKYNTSVKTIKTE